MLFRVLAAAALSLTMLSPAAATAKPRTILFVGNSFTYAGHTAAWKYRADSVTDLNDDGVGGVPAIFKQFTLEAGLDYRVSLETSGGKALSWHWNNRRTLLDKPWDEIVLQDYSTLSREKPGDPFELIDYSGRFGKMFRARNPLSRITLVATWSRPDQTYQSTGHWYGHAIFDMARDLDRGYRAAAKALPNSAVAPAGLAFNCAIRAGTADPNPYDGIGFGKLDLWTYDHYHASIPGVYLEALVVFAKVTGLDPRQLGEDERAARELGLSAANATALQNVAWRTVSGDCAAPVAP